MVSQGNEGGSVDCQSTANEGRSEEYNRDLWGNRGEDHFIRLMQEDLSQHFFFFPGKRMAGANTVSFQTSFGFSFSLNTESNWLFLAVICVVCATVVPVVYFVAQAYKCKNC